MILDSRYWRKRWDEGKIGFHRNETNPLLVDFYDRFIDENSRRVYLPLCGKSEDLNWLRNKGLEVHGCDVSSLAFEAFFKENGLEYESSDHEFRSGNICLHEGDFFALAAEQIGQFDAIYDRAAMVAIEHNRHDDYAKRLLELLEPHGRILLIGFDYDPLEMAGPPFSLSEQNIKTAFHGAKIEQLAETDIWAKETRFQARGLTWLTESAWLIQKTE
jgi:thiopurine S-methyltransferase